jgi:dinuclear metal center YbgI/SA1388 family protein
MKIKEVVAYLESIAPSGLQESYDNAGLLVGDSSMEAKGAVICLDSTEAIIDEAIEKGCNMVIAHHPIIFKGLKRLTGKNYVERTIIKAIKNDIAIYAIHTNLDNVLEKGVNSKIAEKIGLENTRILAPKQNLKKLEVIVPHEASEQVRQALLKGGAGWSVKDHDFAALELKNDKGKEIQGLKMECLFPSTSTGSVLSALMSLKEKIDLNYAIFSLENQQEGIGSGLVGYLPEAVEEIEFLKSLKKKMEAGVVKYTPLRNTKIKKVALCGGSGGFLLSAAKAAGADIFITADYKYHEYFDADGDLIIADIGHYESEQFTKQLLFDILSDKFPNFALHLTEVNTNPVNYI